MARKKEPKQQKKSVPDCEIKKRRIGVWRRERSVYINLRGQLIRNKQLAADHARHDESFIQSVGGRLVPPVPLHVTSRATVGDWQLPPSIVEGFAKQGIVTLYDWQHECLGEILKNSWSSVIYSAPTSGGKSLVADIVLLRRLIFQGKRCVIVCPFVSICRERAQFLRSVLSSSGITIEEMHGPLSKFWHPGIDIAVCTVQKAAGVINRIVESTPDAFSSMIGTIIVDEFHLVCDKTGPMESFVTRLGLLKDRSDVLLVGMSATVPEHKRSGIKSWLESHSRNCLMYESNFRPIDLDVKTKRAKIINNVKSGEIVRELTPKFDPKIDNDFFASLVFESVEANISTIVFCATRNWCENATGMLCRLFKPFSGDAVIKTRIEMIEALRLLSPCGVHPILEESILLGVAFHHAGMTSEERSIIEVGFRNRTIIVLCATSTLSAGVNLPAERVILRTVSSASGGTSNISVASISAKMKQMVGRAGRAGHSTSGEAIIMCSSDKEEQTVKTVFTSVSLASPTESVSQDTTVESMRSVGKEILEIVTFFNVNRRKFFENEFYRLRLDPNKTVISSAIEYLCINKLVAVVKTDGLEVLIPTALGDALAHSAMPPEEAEEVFRELNLARNKLCLAGGDIHLLFLVTPLPVQISEKEFEEFTATSSVFSKPEIRSILAGNDTIPRRKRMMVALMLRDLTCWEGNISQVARKYGVQTGTVQYLQANAATYCAMVSSFCERLQWTSLAAALNSIKPRLHFGVPDELVELMEIEGISPARARALAKAGFNTIEKIASAEPIQIAVAITRDVSIEGTQMTSSETADRMIKTVAHLIINNSKIRLGITDDFLNDTLIQQPSQSSSSSYGVLSPVSPPLIHQLISTQYQPSSEEEEFPQTPAQVYEAFFSPSQRKKNSEDEWLLNALDAIDEAAIPQTYRQSSVERRRRRLSEMTTVDATRRETLSDIVLDREFIQGL
jgi:DNA polymerase theta